MFNLRGLAIGLAFAVLAVPAAHAQTVLKFGAGSASHTPEVQAAMKFSELVAEKSKGAYRVDVLHSGQAGGEREIAEAQQLGTFHFALLGGIVQNFDPALMVVEWDLLFKNDAHLNAALEGEIGEKISERLVNSLSVRPMVHFMRTPRILTTKQPVRSLADLNGMKIRVPEMAARIAIWESLGARPTPMSFPEVVPSLQLGTIEGQENPISIVTANKLQEAIGYLSDTKHLYGFMFLTVSDPFWQNLSDEDRAMFDEAAKEAAAFNNKVTADSEAATYAELRGEMEIIELDVAEWREATKDVHLKFANVDGFSDLYNAIAELGAQY